MTAAGHRRVAALAAALLGSSLAGGCGGASLVIELERVAGDTPFAAVERLEAAVVAESDVLAVAELEVTPGTSGGQLDLDPVPRRAEASLLITGYDADDVAVAAGTATPRLAELAGTCCLSVCFCTLGLFDAGGCSCGSDDCGICP